MVSRHNIYIQRQITATSRIKPVIIQIAEVPIFMLKHNRQQPVMFTMMSYKYFVIDHNQQ